MNRFFTKKSVATAVLLIAASSAYAVSCSHCLCITVFGQTFCTCQVCVKEPGET